MYFQESEISCGKIFLLKKGNDNGDVWSENLWYEREKRHNLCNMELKVPAEYALNDHI